MPQTANGNVGGIRLFRVREVCYYSLKKGAELTRSNEILAIAIGRQEPTPDILSRTLKSFQLF